MNTTKGYYSLVQFCPDPARAEAANIGVLLFCPDKGFIEAKLAKGNDRIRRFFRGQAFDFDRVNFAKHAIERRLKADRDSFESLDDLHRFIETRANEVIITAPRPVKVWEPSKDLRRLYADLVGGRQRQAARVSFVQKLDQALRRPTLANRVRYDLEITVPVANRRLRIPYAYQNGVLNLVKPQVLSAAENHATDTAMRLAAEGTMIAKHPVDGQNAALVVVFGFEGGSAQPALRDRITRLFGEFNVPNYPDEKIDEFAQLVEQQAHQ